jgi:hypothetical protein
MAKSDLRRIIVQAWCMHLDFIPREKVIYIPEPENVQVRGPPMFLDLEEIIYYDQPTLRYRVQINILEVVDWHLPSSSSSDGGSVHGDGPRSYLPHHLSRPWPHTTCFPEQPEYDEPPPLTDGHGRSTPPVDELKGIMIGAIFAPWMPLPSLPVADVAKVRQAGGVSASVEPSRTVKDGAKWVSGDSVPASPMGKVDSDISVAAGFLDWMTSEDCGRDATTLLQDREDPMLLESCL